MGTSVGGVNPVALDLPVICQVSTPPCKAQLLLAWLQFGKFGSSLALILARSCCICSESSFEPAGSYEGFQLAILHCSLFVRLCSGLSLYKLGTRMRTRMHYRIWKPR